MKIVKQNPFLSDSFKSIWLKHFAGKNTSVKAFKYISELEFVKHNNSPFYFNVGKCITKGISYNIDSTGYTDLKNKTLFIYDVPTYFEIDLTQLGDTIKLLKSKQHPGFLIEVDKFKSLSEYLNTNFSKNSRNKNNKYKRRLEASFTITDKMFLGDISKEEYDFVFNRFKLLLEKRFTDKQVSNRNIKPKEWQFYYEVSYKLILEKKASLYVTYNEGQPISITLSFFSEDTLFDAITVFDIDYSKFHLGSITIMKLIEWCIENEIKILDFSKGYFEYKRRWCTKIYDFEYHIYYDSTSLKSQMLAYSIKWMYDFKQRLREKSVVERFHSIKKKGYRKKEKIRYHFNEVNITEIHESLTPINYELSEHKTEKLMIFEFLYLYQENINNVKLFQRNDDRNSYLIKGENRTVAVVINC
jgi:hypothetical protein